MRDKQLTLKGAATDATLAAKVCAISEQQTETKHVRSAVTALPTATAANS
jgi:hypothetical protein